MPEPIRALNYRTALGALSSLFADFLNTNHLNMVQILYRDDLLAVQDLAKGRTQVNSRPYRPGGRYSAIVAGKLANKAVSTAAEPAERRAGTEGNANQQSMGRAQNRGNHVTSAGAHTGSRKLVERFAVTHPRWEKLWGVAEAVAPSSSMRPDGGGPMSQVNDLSRSLAAFDPPQPWWRLSR